MRTAIKGSIAPKPQRRSLRYWLQQFHLWIGLVLLLPLVMMGVTGAVLVYAHDIEHLLGQGEPAVKTVGEWQSPSALIEAARTASKEPGRIPIAVRWPIEAGEPAAVRLSRPGMATERPQFRGEGRREGGQAQQGAQRNKAGHSRAGRRRRRAAFPPAAPSLAASSCCSIRCRSNCSRPSRR